MSKARSLADLGNVYDDGALSNRNVIINGDFSIWQRGTSSTSTGWGYYTADRWNTTLRDGAGTMSQYDMGSELRPFIYAFKTAITSSATSSPAVQQKIEDSRRFKGQTVTLSFYAKASKDITVDTYFNLIWANTDNYTTAQSNNITTSWQKFTLTTTLPDPSGTYNSTYDHLHCRFDLPTSDTYDFYIVGVQLEYGDTATPFEHRSFGDELARCQRYYAQGGIILSDTALYRYHNTINLPCEMRAQPTISTGGIDSGSGGTMYSTFDSSGSANSKRNFYQSANNSALSNAWFAFDAEL